LLSNVSTAYYADFLPSMDGGLMEKDLAELFGKVEIICFYC